LYTPFWCFVVFTVTLQHEQFFARNLTNYKQQIIGIMGVR